MESRERFVFRHSLRKSLVAATNGKMVLKNLHNAIPTLV